MSSMTDTMTGQEWCDAYGVTFDWTADGYQLDPSGWEHHAYTITLQAEFPGDGFIYKAAFPWRQGLGIDEEPTADSTLWAIAGDARYGGMEWEEFADEFGYDALEAPLSEYRTWEACKEMRQRVFNFCPSQEMFERFCEIAEADES